MFTPILSVLVAREQYKDRLREAEQDRLIEIALTHQSADRRGQRASGNLLLAVRYMFKALARAS